ncbi:MAG TPA: tetratricopeptide repeat protein [Flavobacteriales bacterium]|nr:tetratricopeptide repeat protein [Flavobacteriales bacterium]
MIHTRSILICVFLLAARLDGYAQNIDSLKQLVKHAKSDSIKIKALVAWDNLIYFSDPTSDLKLNKQIVSLSKKNLKKKLSKSALRFYKKSLASSLNNLGLIARTSGKLQEALAYHSRSLELSKELKDVNGEMNAVNNLGNIYLSQGLYGNAMDYYTRSLYLAEKAKDKDGEATTLINIGTIHLNQSNYPEAEKYFIKSLKALEFVKGDQWKSYALSNLGIVFSKRNEYAKAKLYYEKSLEINKRLQNQEGIISGYNNLGLVCSASGDSARAKGNQAYAVLMYKKARDFYDKSISEAENHGQRSHIPSALINKAGTYARTNELNTAIKLGKQSLEIATELRLINEQRHAFQVLYESYKNVKDFSNALSMHEKYMLYKDSMQREFKYEFGKKAAADSVSHAREQELKNAEIARKNSELSGRKKIQFILLGVLVLVCVFGVFIYNRYRITQKQKIVIEEQKRLAIEQHAIIEEKQKEIIDSILYAKRIQQAQLPTDKIVHKNLERLNKN